jgi:uncharacterized protein (DUF2141 family)
VRITLVFLSVRVANHTTLKVKISGIKSERNHLVMAIFQQVFAD